MLVKHDSRKLRQRRNEAAEPYRTMVKTTGGKKRRANTTAGSKLSHMKRTKDLRARGAKTVLVKESGASVNLTNERNFTGMYTF